MKRLLKFAAALAGVLIVALVALSFLFDANRFRPLLEQQMSQALGRPVTIGDLKLALWSGGVSASDLAIADDPAFGKQPFLTAKSLNIGVDLSALIFQRALHVKAFTVDGADVSLVQSKNGEWNFSSLGSGAAPADTSAPPAKPEAKKDEPKDAGPAPASANEPLDLAVQLVRITNSSFHLTLGAAKHEFRDVNFELRDFSPSTSMPFTLSAKAAEGGTLKLDGKAGPIGKPDAAATPFDAKVQIDGLDLAKGGFTDPAAGIGGLLTMQGEANSNGKTAAVTGAVTVDKLKLAPKGTPAAHPVGINIALAHDLKARKGTIARSVLKLGSAEATLSGSYDLSGDHPVIDAKLNGPKMPVPELLSFLPALDVQLPAGSSVEGGTVNLDLTSRGTMANLNTTGSIKVQQTKLNYDLSSKLRVIEKLAAVPRDRTTAIALLASGFETGPQGAKVSGIQIDAPTIGQITGDGTVSPKHELDFRMKAVMKTGGAVAVMLAQRGETTTVPFFIRGTTSDPSFSADVKSLANEKLQQVVKNPEGAAKNAVDTARGVLNLFKKAPPKSGDTK